MSMMIDTKYGAEHTKIKTHFARIIVGGVADKPCYSILYYDPADDEFHQGFGSYHLAFVFRWLAEEFEIVGDAFWCEPVRHGRWLPVRGKFNNPLGEKCSKCGRRVGNGGENYCPKCGAKMDGGAVNEKE